MKRVEQKRIKGVKYNFGAIYNALYSHDNVENFIFNLFSYSDRHEALNSMANWLNNKGFLTTKQVLFASSLINDIERG